MILTFKDFKTLSLNQLFGRAHWSKRAALNEEWHWRTKSSISSIERKMFEKPVSLDFLFKLKKPIDPDNAIVYAKFIVDSLKHEGILKDDTYKEISSISLRVEKAKENEITVYVM